ncbi:hypothetical protein N7532_011889 [Penicillium argentinense]|uniref:Ubiquinone biosynthesis protein n=1 Tax=Penicillium argentinense TaxID=1131581 RepID=A0A9W9JVF8_9EURO|nr:uncharacterized protein N7532_011889 [Penicillium argentinense]KAJ5082846.1 hypothetical protein N7532_011889 [Penicillium argentinense]
MASLRASPFPRRALASYFQSVRLQPTPLNTATLLPRIQPTRSPRTCSSASIRPYHSTLHPRLPEHEYTNSQTAILTAALHHIPAHGFTLEALTLGARDAGFLDVSVQLLPRAEFDLILFWLASRRGILRSRVEEAALFTKRAAGSGRDPASLSVEEKTKILIAERLRMNTEIKAHWQDALAQMSLLGNIPISLSELHALSNDILSLAGDSSVDGSWYTRRMAVSAIYASAEVVMTRDPTPDLSETIAFVDRRFEDKLVLKEKFEGVGQCVSFWGNTAVGVGRSWGMKI